MPDQPTRLESTAALAALVHALVASSNDGPAADRGAYAENRWAASRFGREARLIHPSGNRLAAVPELLDELAEPVGAELVAPLRDLDQSGEQLAIGRERGLPALCERLVSHT
jgi:gamma-glutamyl:cysteine ligase YbdK (ATP-grasp superfamily)